MRFLVAEPGPHFSVQDVAAGWIEALVAAGQDVHRFNLGDRLTFYNTVVMPTGDGLFVPPLSPEQATETAVNGLYASLMRTRPHVLLLVSGFFIPPELPRIARAAGVRVVFVATESPYEDGRQTALAEQCDLTILNDPTNLARFPGGTQYFPHAYRPSVHRPGAAKPDLECDLGFVGTAYPSRIAFLESMDLAGLDVLLAGNWQALDEDSPLRKYLAHDDTDCLDNESTVDVYRSARVGLNLYRREAETDAQAAGWAMGPREVEMAAAGLFFLRDPRPEGDEVLSALPTFTDPAEASEQLRWWLARPGARAGAVAKARAAIEDRTFDQHACRLLRLLEGK